MKPFVSIADALVRPRPQALEAQCPSGKTAYRSRWSARNVISILADKSQRFPGRKFPAREYECPTCKLWHLTSMK